MKKRTEMGIVKYVSPVIQKTETFSLRELILEVDFNSAYPQAITIQFTGDKKGLVSHLKPGQVVEVAYNFRGKLQTDEAGNPKAFTNLQGWKVRTFLGNEPAAPAPDGIAQADALYGAAPQQPASPPPTEPATPKPAAPAAETVAQGPNPNTQQTTPGVTPAAQPGHRGTEDDLPF